MKIILKRKSCTYTMWGDTLKDALLASYAECNHLASEVLCRAHAHASECELEQEFKCYCQDNNWQYVQANYRPSGRYYLVQKGGKVFLNGCNFSAEITMLKRENLLEVLFDTQKYECVDMLDNEIGDWDDFEIEKYLQTFDESQLIAEVSFEGLILYRPFQELF